MTASHEHDERKYNILPLGGAENEINMNNHKVEQDNWNHTKKC